MKKFLAASQTDRPTQLNQADPISRFNRWMQKAVRSGLREPGAMALATTSTEGRPSVRMVLLKGADERGFTFFTNLKSRKGKELAATASAALCFYWMPLGRQVRIEGLVQQVDDTEGDEYFASRPRLSKLGAWASRQSQPMKSAFELERKLAQYVARFGTGHIPRPPFWSGFRVIPETIEFWREKPFRRHERTLYSRVGDTWQTEQLFP